ncbi:hydroxyisourate hydrolase [Paenibacillus sp. SI8]|uniref:hydroxyisourate hydrolase n=1 Tax=unclassified Paenibacillus TaxID=185978 RepID=UPI003465E31A
MSAGLTTHVLDISNGSPASGVRIELFRLQDAGAELLRTTYTNADGRVAEAILSGEAFKTGVYELVFHVGDYFKQRGIDLAEPAFLDQVPIRFGISNREAHYHVPLLIAPWGYNTYRGS